MKEEKISIFKIKNPCTNNCGLKDIQSCKTCNVKKQYDEAISYDTAIEKMAKGICRRVYNKRCKENCKDCDIKSREKILRETFGMNQIWLGQAKAALNALLEDK